MEWPPFQKCVQKSDVCVHDDYLSRDSVQDVFQYVLESLNIVTVTGKTYKEKQKNEPSASLRLNVSSKFSLR